MRKKVNSYWRLRHAAFQYLRTYGLKQTILATIKYVFVHKNPTSVQGKPPAILRGVEAIWVSSDQASPSHTYRVENNVLSANLIGIHAVHLHTNELRALSVLPKSIRLIVFWRTNVSIDDLEVLKDPNVRRNVVIVYDTDDLTFSKDAYTLENVAGLRQLSASHADHLVKEVAEAQRAQIMDSDYFWGSTKKLAEESDKLGVKSFVLPNTLPIWMIEDPIKKEKRSLDELKIVYASGSDTHRTDFLQAWPALMEFLSKNSNATLTILGHSPISRSEVDRAIRKQVLLKPPVPHSDLIREIAKYDINIAPVEFGNPFVEAKSALKYAQAGLAGVPTIASESEEFRAAIQNNQNGWLAKDTEGWLSALTAASHEQTRLKVGETARLDVLKNHSPVKNQERLRTILEKIRSHKADGEIRLNIIGSKKKVVWVLPDLPSGSGGHRNVLRFANYLPRDEYECTVLVLDSASSDRSLSKQVLENYTMGGFRVTSDRSCVDSSDAIFATHHRTVDFVNAFANHTSKKFYLVQDFEALFHPMGGEYLHALASLFDMSFEIICSGAWMSNKILEVTGRHTEYFNFPVDREIYHEDPLSNPTSRTGIAFFAKNDTPRRLYDLGIEALEKVSNIRPDIEISLFGGGSLENGTVNKKFNVLGKLPNLADLANLYRKSAVGVVFSTTNPSLVPYEMLACGLPVVDVKVPGDQFDPFGADSSVLRAEPESSRIAMSILNLLENKDIQSSLISKGRNLIQGMPTEQEVAKQMDLFLRKHI